MESALARAVEAGRQLERQTLMAQTTRGIFQEEIREVLNALTSPEAALKYIAGAIPRWIARWRERTSPILLTQMQMTEMQTDRGSASLGFDLSDPALERYFNDYTLRLATRVTQTTQEKLTQIIRESAQDGSGVDETARRIQEVGEDFSRNRSLLISATELHRASVEAGEIRARESGVVMSRTWLSASDDRVRPLHRTLNGKTVGMDEEFAPGVKSPADEIRCRCVLLYNIAPEMLGGAA